MQDNVVEKCKVAKDESSYAATLSTEDKNRIIGIISDALTIHENDILEANANDVSLCKDKPRHFIDRLKLNKSRLVSIINGIKRLSDLKDPINEVIEEWVTDNTSLVIKKIRVPLGVIGIIYEARPNVTVDAICLAVKTGNAVVLRGSKDAINTNISLVDSIKKELKNSGYRDGFIQFIDDVSHESANLFMKQRQYIDVLLPRGSASFIKNVVEISNIPVIETGAGNCHAYVERSADLKKASDIILNGKLSRPSVCNALESILIDECVAQKFLPPLLDALSKNGVEIRGCAKTLAIWKKALPAQESDWSSEYGSLIVSVRVVSGTEEAVMHITKYGTHHSEVIISEDEDAVRKFMSGVDSAVVYANASTRFTDGYEFGYGAEMGISTQKLHARGPMGLKELTSYKYLVYGCGQIRE